MSNKNPSNQFAKDKQPVNPRGRGKQSLILDAIKKAAVLGIDENSTKQDTEIAVFEFMAKAAFNPTGDEASISSFCLGQLMKKGWPDLKSVMPCVEFDFDVTATPAMQAAQVMKAASTGQISPDIANMFVSSIASMLKIEEVTELKNRLTEIEKALGISNE